MLGLNGPAFCFRATNLHDAEREDAQAEKEVRESQREHERVRRGSAKSRFLLGASGSF